MAIPQGFHHIIQHDLHVVHHNTMALQVKVQKSHFHFTFPLVKKKTFCTSVISQN